MLDIKPLYENLKIRAKIITIISRLDSVLNYPFFLNYCDFEGDDELIDHVDSFNSKYKNSSINIDEFEQTLKRVKKYKADPNTENKNELEKIIYPFDIFGTSDFISFVSTLKHQFINKFTTYVSDELIVFIRNKEFTNLIEKIAHISLLRHYIMHNGNPSGTDIKKHNGDIVVKNINPEKSLEALFLFIPDYLSKNISDLICSVCEKDFGDKVKEIQKKAVQTNTKHIININNHLKEEEKKKLNEIKREYYFITNYKLFSFIKNIRFIEEKNISQIRGIIKKTINKVSYEDLQKITINGRKYEEKTDKKQKSVIKKTVHKIKFEEVENIFNFFLSLNEILHTYFIYYYEEIKPRNKKLAKIRIDIAHSKIFFNFENDIKEILMFFDNEYKKHLENNENLHWQNYKQIKSSFIKSLKALLNRKDYFYLLASFPKQKDMHRCNKQIIKLSPQKNKDFPKKNMRVSIKNKVSEVYQNPNNTDVKISIGKYIYLNLLRNNMKQKILEINDNPTKVGSLINA